jgi:hypothetical protein
MTPSNMADIRCVVAAALVLCGLLPDAHAQAPGMDAQGRLLTGTDQGIWRGSAPSGKLYAGTETGVFAGAAAKPARAASSSSFFAFENGFTGGVSVPTARPPQPASGKASGPPR